MELLTLLKDLAVGLSWPFVLIFIAIFFAPELRERIRDISEAGPGGLKFHQPKAAAPLPAPATSLPETVPYVEKEEERIRSALSKLQNEDPIRILVREVAVAQTTARSESVFGSIFASQIKALRLVVDHGGSTSLDQIRSHFQGVKDQFPDFYREVEFETWLNYLVVNGLVEIKDENASVTDFGHAFLMYAETKMQHSAKSF